MSDLLRRAAYVNEDRTFTLRFWQYLTELSNSSNEFQDDIDRINISLELLLELVPKQYNLNAARTTEGNEFILANGYDVTLNPVPNDGEMVEIKSQISSSKIKGNGRNVEGLPEITTGIIGESLMVRYWANPDAWYIV